MSDSLYIYCTELYCEDCGRAIRAELAPELDSGDSDDYPQSVPAGESDSPNHCASREDCLNAVDLTAYGLEPGAELYGAESRKIGALLGEELTPEGVSDAYELLTDEPRTPYQSALHRLWRESFPAVVERMEADARRRGVEDGTAAGSWVIDGNTSEDSARELLGGIEDGDPLVLDSLPGSPLSGEYADGLLPRDVLQWYGLTEDDNEADDILTAYETGYSEGVVDEVERSARAIARVRYWTARDSDGTAVFTDVRDCLPCEARAGTVEELEADTAEQALERARELGDSGVRIRFDVEDVEYETELDVWQLIEQAPEYASDVADLYHWSTNYDPGRGPMTLFLDLIGWSVEELGEPLYSVADASLGYVELAKLADALKQYADRPSDVGDFVNELMEAEARP